MRAATGIQHELTAETSSGRARAIVTEVAAGLRAYSVEGIDLVETFPAEQTPPMSAGIVLVPWPNRVRDGVWMLDGVAQQLDLSEPLLHNAIHGLLTSTGYDLVDRAPGAVTLGATVFPQSGYPFLLDTSVTYELTDDGLDVTHTLHNVGTAPAPVAVGVHPYLKIGDVPTGDLVLRVAASTHLEVDDRLNPTGVETPVAGTGFDLRAGRRVDELALDDAFGGVEVGVAAGAGSAATAVDELDVVDELDELDELDEPGDSGAGEGRGEHSLTAPDGRRLTVWGDENMRYVQVFTTREFPVHGSASAAGARPGTSIAIEPMTAPANAFNSGAGLRWLQPGESWTVRWGIRHSGFQA